MSSQDDVKRGLLIVARAIVALERFRIDFVVDGYMETAGQCAVCGQGGNHAKGCEIATGKTWLAEVEAKVRVMNKTSDLHAALIAKFPALEDRERYAALWQVAEQHIAWAESTLDSLITHLWLDWLTLDDANTHAEIVLEYRAAIDQLNEDYQHRIRDIQSDYYANLKRENERAEKEFAEFARDVVVEAGESDE